MTLPDPPPVDLVASARRVNRAMIFLGAALFSVGLRFFLIPGALERSSVGRALHGYWDEGWSAAFVIGGLLIMSGVAFRRPRLELPGVTLAATGIIVNGIAIVVTNGTAAISQLPLYVLSLWVLDGRRRDLTDLPQERRRGKQDTRRDRVERRHVAIAAVPVMAALVAQQQPENGQGLAVTLIVAVLGGGAVTALVQALLYKPQKRDLEARLGATAVQAAQAALDTAERRADGLEEELEDARARIAALESDLGEARAELEEARRRIGELEAAVEPGA